MDCGGICIWCPECIASIHFTSTQVRKPFQTMSSSTVSFTLTLSEEDAKDQQRMIEIAQRVANRGNVEVKDFWFETMFLSQKQSQESEDSTHNDETETKNEEKESSDDEKKERNDQKLSQIIDTKKTQMCRWAWVFW